MNLTVYMKIPMDSVATDDEIEALLQVVSTRGFSTDLNKAQHDLKPYASEVGISRVGVPDAVLDAKHTRRNL